MSYTRNYRETITVRGSQTVTRSYPSSQSGGSMSVTVHYEEHVPVDVQIHVDTDPFDSSVESCNEHVNLLTGAVVATEAAQIASKHKNSRKIGSTIIAGFFGYIRSEISQQVAELSIGIESQLMHLTELTKAVVAKKTQMETDFNRISSRYAKIFDDLNHEFANRVYELDKPAFVFKKETDNQKIRVSGNDLVNTVAVAGTESSALRAKITSSIAKKRALDTLNKAKSFLYQQAELNNTIRKSMLNESAASTKFAPVCFFETKNLNELNRELQVPKYVSTLQPTNVQDEIKLRFEDKKLVWKEVPKEQADNLNLYFNDEINKSYPNPAAHDLRVRNMIRQIAKISTVKGASVNNI